MKRPAEGEQILTMQLAREALLKDMKNVKSFYDLLNDREAIRKGRERGLHGRHLYDTLTGDFADYLRKYKSTNVHRWHDATTQGLHAFCAAEKRSLLSADVDELKRQLVLNFAVWRLLGGTVAFAAEVGFLTAWGEREKGLIRSVIQKAFEEGRVTSLLSNAYSWPRKMRDALTRGRPGADALQMVLHNKGQRVLKGFAVADVTLVGKFNVLDRLWEVCEQVVQAAKADRNGVTSMQRVGAVLLKVPYFGSGQNKERRPSFFAKELLQDLVDTPVFPGGRAKVGDHFTFCPVGPGSTKGLELIFKRKSIEPSETLPMMQGLWSFAKEFFHGEELELHDIQFQLCEYQKKFNAVHRVYSALPADCGGPMLHWTKDFVSQRLREMLTLTGKPYSHSRPALSLAKEFSNWMGASFRQNNSSDLFHGDLVLLQDATSHKYYSIGANGVLVKVCKQSDAAKFIVTTDATIAGAAKAIGFAQPIFLETCGCKQLAWWVGKSCFAARANCRRFDPQSRLSLLPTQTQSTAVQPNVQPNVQLNVQLNRPVKLKSFNDLHGLLRDPICFSRPTDLVDREDHLLRLIEADLELDAPEPKRRRISGKKSSFEEI